MQSIHYWKNVLFKVTARTHLQSIFTPSMFPLQGAGFDPFSLTKSRCVALQEGIHSPVCLQLAFKCAHTCYTNAKNHFGTLKWTEQHERPYLYCSHLRKAQSYCNQELCFGSKKPSHSLIQDCLKESVNSTFFLII